MTHRTQNNAVLMTSFIIVKGTKQKQPKEGMHRVKSRMGSNTELPVVSL